MKRILVLITAMIAIMIGSYHQPVAAQENRCNDYIYPGVSQSGVHVQIGHISGSSVTKEMIFMQGANRTLGYIRVLITFPEVVNVTRVGMLGGSSVKWTAAINSSMANDGSSSTIRSIRSNYGAVNPLGFADYISVQAKSLVYELSAAWDVSTAASEASTMFIERMILCWSGVDFGDDPPEASFSAYPTSGGTPLEVDFTDTSTGTITSWSWDFGDSTSSTAQHPTHTYTSPGIYEVELTASGPGGSDTATTEISVYGDGVPGGNLYKPLRGDTIYSTWGMFDYSLVDALDPLYFSEWNIPSSYLFNPIDFWGGGGAAMSPTHLFNLDANTVVAPSSGIQNVYAVAEGTVISVSKVGGCQINLWVTTTATGECYVKIPDPITDANDHLYRMDTSSAWVVKVRFDDGISSDRFIQYVVSSPKVRVGDQITAGCIIGQTVGLFHLVGGEFQTLFNTAWWEPESSAVQVGVTEITLMDGSNDTYPLLPSLVLDSNLLTPCNANPELAACAGDSELRDPNQWAWQGVVQWLPTGGARLNAVSAIEMPGLPLSQSGSYSVTAQIRRLDGAGSGSVTLRLGMTEQTFALDQQMNSYTIPAGTHDPDQGLLYGAHVINSGQVPFEVISLCVAEGTANTVPSTCYFKNYSFDYGTSNWTVSGVNPGILAGELAAGDGATLSQPAKLYPNGAQSYAYTITVRATIYGATNPETDMTSTVSFDWLYPASGSWEPFISPASTSTYAFGAFYGNRPNGITFFEGNEVLFQGVIDVAALTDDVLTVRVNIDDSGQSNFAGGVLIREICISDAFAHWPDDAGGGGRPLPFPVNCSVVSAPTGNDLGAWTWYLWSNLDQFFSCDLMVMLNQMFNVMYDIYDFVTWQGLYWQSVAIKTIEWFGAYFIPWLNGHFINMAGGVPQEGSCNNIFCLMETLINGFLKPLLNLFDRILDLAELAATLLGTVISAIINIAMTVFTQLMSLYTTFSSMLTAIVNAWNTAEPTPIPGLPSCALDPRSNAVCITLWMMEHTIFSGRGALFIPILISLGSVNLLLWAVKTFKRELRDMAAST